MTGPSSGHLTSVGGYVDDLEFDRSDHCSGTGQCHSMISSGLGLLAHLLRFGGIRPPHPPHLLRRFVMFPMVK